MAPRAQNAGKSTLCRYLANASSQKVALLDLDCGQLLSGPPGSLPHQTARWPFLAETSHGNNFGTTHIQVPPRPRTRDAHVGAAAALLKAHWASHLTDTKLVVNACGWATGLGAEITVGLISTIATDACWFVATTRFFGDRRYATSSRSRVDRIHNLREIGAHRRRRGAF